jgi:sirohydrochlorin cobaltochelatase
MKDPRANSFANKESRPRSRDSQCGYLIVGHGTRELAGQAEFRDVVRQLTTQLAEPVAGGFLELAEPTIADALAELATRGVKRVIIVPLLLFTAGHAKEDVPGEVAQAASVLGMEVVGQASALELHPSLLELSRLRFREALGSNQVGEETRLLLVGRGGSVPLALEAMRSYTAALSASLNVLGETAFAAVAKPSVEEALAELARRGTPRAIVQPHLLFQGEVLASIADQVAATARSYPDRHWSLAGHLEPHPLLIEAVLSRVREVSSPREA